MQYDPAERMELRFNVDIRDMNSFGIAAKAACTAEYYSIDELSEICRDTELPRPFKSIGGGSNLLFTKDFGGTLLHSRIRFIEPYCSKGVCTARVGAGVPWDEFCGWCAERALWGPENLSMIPGDTGAAAVQNIGAYGVEISDIISTVECFDLQSGRMVLFGRDECAYGYRDSFFKHDGGRYVVTAVSFSLSTEYNPVTGYGNVMDRIVEKYGSYSVYGKALTPELVRRTIMEIRREKLPDPALYGNAGSFFRNPCVTKEKFAEISGDGRTDVPHFAAEGGLVKIPAAWMIDRCGWKGYREGNVGVWEKQPLVLVNMSGKASGAEIEALEQKIRASVKERFGVELRAEVEHI